MSETTFLSYPLPVVVAVEGMAQGAAVNRVGNDVSQLLDSLGVSGLDYQEFGAGQRREMAAGRWPLLSSVNRHLGYSAQGREVPGGELDACLESSKPDRCVIALVSPCGGSGRTTVAANLGHALSQNGSKSFLADCDPANSLATHFGVEPNDPRGLAWTGGAVSDLSALLSRQQGPVPHLPFGHCTYSELSAVEARLVRDPNWLRLRLEAFTPADTRFVIVDTPAGRSAWSRQALSLADQVLVILPSTPAAYASIAAMESFLDETLGRSRSRAAAAYLVNGFDGCSALERDVYSSLRGLLSSRLIPLTIQKDEVVREAAANRRTVLHEAIDSQVISDYAELAAWLNQRWASHVVQGGVVRKAG